MNPLLVDVTEFVTNPIRTGIQRVIRQMLALWPDDVAKQVVWFDPRVEGLAPVSDELLDFLLESGSDPQSDSDALTRRSQAYLSSVTRPAVQIGRSDRILLPELFASKARADFYRGLAKRGVPFRAIVYDLIAWAQPNAVDIKTLGPLNDFLQVLGLAQARCHISVAVRNDYVQRVLRAESAIDTVIPLGADALGSRRMGGPVLPRLVFPGALDGRKGQDRVFDAYLALPKSRRLPLVVAGRVPAEPRPSMLRILDSDCPTLTVIDDPDDQQLAELIATAQGCLFPSQHEGFGLPAVESLHLGTPVVVDAALPAISGLPALGQIRLNEQSPASLTAALLTISDPREAARLRREAAQLDLPTWADYATRVATWATS